MPDAPGSLPTLQLHHRVPFRGSATGANCQVHAFDSLCCLRLFDLFRRDPARAWCVRACVNWSLFLWHSIRSARWQNAETETKVVVPPLMHPFCTHSRFVNRVGLALGCGPGLESFVCAARAEFHECPASSYGSFQWRHESQRCVALRSCGEEKFSFRFVLSVNKL